MRTLVVAMLLIVAAAPGWAQDGTRETLERSPRHQEWAEVPSGDRTVNTFVAYPERRSNALAVIVIHENRGLTDWVRSFADQLAGKGFVALAPDLLSDFDDTRHRTRDFENPDAAREALYTLDPQRVTADLLAVKAYARGLSGANGKVAVVGFCWGGAQAFRFATDTAELAAACVFYGAPPEDSTALARIVAPVYGFYAADDQRINATIDRTRAAMKRLHKVYKPEIYPQVGHAFMRRADEPDGTEADRKARDRALDRLVRILATAR